MYVMWMQNNNIEKKIYLKENYNQIIVFYETNQ